MAQEALALDFEWRSRRFYDASKGLAALSAHLDRKFTDIGPLINAQLRGWLEDVAEALEKRHSSPWPDGTGEKTLSKRSGWMIEQITNSITVTGKTIPTIRGTIAVPYERKIHERGGVIRAKKAQYLTIPLPAALDSKGIPLRKKARDWDNTFVLKSKKGNLLIVQRQGTQIVPLYVLKKEVYIPPRLGMEETLRAGSTLLADRLTDAILKSLVGG